MERPLGIHTSRTGDTLLIRLTGELDVYTSSEVPSTADAVFGQGLTSVVLDLTDLEYMDSTGLRQILRLHRVTRASNVGFTVRSVENTVISRMLKLIGAGDVFPLEILPDGRDSRPDETPSN